MSLSDTDRTIPCHTIPHPEGSFQINFLSMPVSSVWSLPPVFHTKNLLTLLCLQYYYMRSPSQFSRCDHSKILDSVYRSLSYNLSVFIHSNINLVPLRHKTYYKKQSILKNPQPRFLSQCQRPYITSIEHERKIRVLYILILNNNLENTRFSTG